MAQNERPKIDKAKWGPGPWQNEPDHIEWRYRGVPCLIHRQPTAGHLCGYAAVEPGHPWHGKDFAGFAEDLPLVDVHGGTTYASKCAGPICHAPQAGEPDDVWWIGFDCAHLGDLSPGHQRSHSTLGEAYRTEDYVRRETEMLADQIIAARERGDE